jgi:hypothetical protein
MYKCEDCGELTDGAKGYFNWSMERGATIGVCDECRTNGGWFVCHTCLMAKRIEERFSGKFCNGCARKGEKQVA